MIGLVSGIGLELGRSAGTFGTDVPAWWLLQLAGLTAAIPMVWRRSKPLLVAVALATHMFIWGVWSPIIMSQFSLQVLYFYSFFNAVAWARGRRQMAIVMSAIVVFMFGWIAWQVIAGVGMDEGLPSVQLGSVDPHLARVLYSFLINIFYFGAAITTGQFAWARARQSARLAEQAAEIARQSEQLRTHAVVEERLRIARELHDVVAHHIAVMGIQAAAARKVLDKKPAAAAEPLRNIEESSRQAVGEMRTLLGTLRAGDSDQSNRTTSPGLDELPSLAAQFTDSGLRVTYTRTDESPTATEIPSSIDTSLYRIVAEALSNVARHSTAHAATVAVRLVSDTPDTAAYAEAEVLDDGRPRPGTAGSGLGLIGMRERAAALNGHVEVGPRVNGGFRVRVRLPLTGVDA